MQVDQKHITTIRLNETRGNNVSLVKDGRGFRLTIVSHNDVVNILLTAHEVQQLYQALARQHSQNVGIQEYLSVPTVCAAAPEGSTEGYCSQWTTFDWLSFN